MDFVTQPFWRLYGGYPDSGPRASYLILSEFLDGIYNIDSIYIYTRLCTVFMVFIPSLYRPKCLQENEIENPQQKKHSLQIRRLRRSSFNGMTAK